MATNNVTSGKLPKTIRQDRVVDPGQSLFEGDPVKEALSGQRGRLGEIAAQPMEGITATQRDALAAKAGIRVKRAKVSL